MKATTLYTIGHGRRTIEDFINLLKKNEIDYLIDVRTFPYSRFNPQYNQKALSATLEKFGIRYVFMGDALGGRPKDTSCYVDGKIDYDLLREKPYFRDGIERLKTAYRNGNRIALMCSESNPNQCHRTVLIAKVLNSENIPLLHIDEKGKLRSDADLTNS
jgi:uncharacterized protein (DUF488 family)